MPILLPDAVQALTGLNPADWVNRFEPLPPSFRTLALGDANVRWTDVAAEAGYSDQSHLCRETRRVTGFGPDELRQRIAKDESFWIYRIWT